MMARRERRDHDRMMQALALGARASGAPNPGVGCVIARSSGVVVGTGQTGDGGRPHAEEQALAMAGDAARGALVWLTLEPCAHVSAAGVSCAEALVRARPKRVCVAMRDPDPRTQGRGVAALRAAGIEVVEGVAAAQAAQAHRGFVSRLGRGRPWLTLKLATSLDGAIATRTGESEWITGEDARFWGRALRARADAVLTGSATLRCDDARLTARLDGMAAEPLRVVVATDFDLDPSLRFFAQESPCLVIGAEDASAAKERALAATGARTLRVSRAAAGAGAAAAGVDLAQALAALAGLGVNEVLAEAGGRLAGALMKARLADSLAVFRGPVVLGGDSMPALAGWGAQTLAEGARLTAAGGRRFAEGDRLEMWDIAWPEAGAA